MATASPVAKSLRDPAKPLANVVEQLNNHVLAREARENEILWHLWNDVMDLAAKTPPGEQDRLIDFMILLQKSTLRSGAGEPLRSDDGALWGDLPRFGWAAREAWNWDPHDPDATEDDYAQWDNKTNFLARLTGSLPIQHAGRQHPLDYSLYGLWALRSAFEEERPEAVSNGPAIRNAALWILHAGAMLRKLSAEGVEMPARSGIAGSKIGAEKEWMGFNEERWRLWRDGFQEAAGDVDAARLAAEIMRSLE